MLTIIQVGYAIEFFVFVPPNSFVITPPSVLLTVEVLELLNKEAIEPVRFPFMGSGFYSHYFLVPKRDRGLRTIMDLRALNRYITYTKFCMIILQSILPLITKDAWLASIDLKDAYLHVSICPQHCRFLHFAVGSAHYQFKILPFGLLTAPRVFTKIMAVVVAFLRLPGICLPLH